MNNQKTCKSRSYEKNISTYEELFIGDWCIFSNLNTETSEICFANIIVGKILSFSYFKKIGKSKQYSLINAPTKLYLKESDNNVGVLCTWYKLEENGELHMISPNRHNFLNISKYLLTIPEPTFNTDINMLIITSNYLEIIKKKINVLKNQSTSKTNKTSFELTEYSDSDTDTSENISLKSDTLTETFNSTDDEESEMNLLIEHYYAIYYDDSWYIGRLVKIEDNILTIKFLKSELDRYVWPKKDDIQTLCREFVFFGPIKLIGNNPFFLKRCDFVKISKMYKTLKNTYK